MTRDLVVTVPKDFFLCWLVEGDLPGEPPGGVFGPDAAYDFTCGRATGPKPPIEPGDRVYVVAHGRLRGYAPLVEVKAVNGRWSLVRAGGAVACTIDEPIRGFQGWRARWWSREVERPFPTWKTEGVAVPCAGHPKIPAVVWYGGLDEGQLFAFGSCATCADRIPIAAASKGKVLGRDFHVIADLRLSPAEVGHAG